MAKKTGAGGAEIRKTRMKPRCYLLSAPQDMWLTKWSQEMGIGKAEMLRRIIDEHRERYGRTSSETVAP